MEGEVKKEWAERLGDANTNSRAGPSDFRIGHTINDDFIGVVVLVVVVGVQITTKRHGKKDQRRWLLMATCTLQMSQYHTGTSVSGVVGWNVKRLPREKEREEVSPCITRLECM